jgi:uncharacterized protein YydD (DUF2326 family)
MITKVSSDLESFKTLVFNPGLNVLLAEKSKGATDRQSRNGAGKSSFVELIHFLLGSNVRDTIFSDQKLTDFRFSLEFDLAGKSLEVSRSGKNSSKVYLSNQDYSDWPIKPTKGKAEHNLTNDNWKQLLGYHMFDLPLATDDQSKYKPSFRKLFPYFARRVNDGGFFSPTACSQTSQAWDEQVCVSYLIGLDWSIAQSFQQVRDKEKGIKELKKIVKSGTMPEVLSSSSDLKTRLTIVEDKVKSLYSQLQSFQVVPEYKELEKEASKLTKEISKLSGDNTLDGELLSKLQDSLSQEQEPAFTSLEKLYEEAGIILPKQVLKRFDDVKEFHEKIVSNRKAHLHSEITSVNSRITDRDKQKTSLDKRRADIMQILQAGGALDHFTKLQEEFSRLRGEAENLREKLKVAEQVERDSTTLKIERAQLSRQLQDDYVERDDTRKEAILIFERLSNALYEKAGSLIIDPTENGPHFDVKLDSSRSKGISNMKIFCFDMMLLELTQKHHPGTGFLIHDSHLFDGVDERQKAKALEIGHQKCQELGVQYIVTMNSDDIPSDGFSEGFNLEDFILETRLSDREDGGLFGFHFN